MSLKNPQSKHSVNGLKTGLFSSYSNNAITVAAMPKLCTNLRNTESLLRRPKIEEVRAREYLWSDTATGWELARSELWSPVFD